MCGIAEAALAVSIAGTAMGTMGTIQQGQQAKAQANYQAAVLNNQATMAEWQAQDVEKRGAEEEYRQRLNTQRMMGTQRSMLAASGVQVDDGSAVDVLGDTAALGELDALEIRANTERQAWSARAQSQQYASDAAATRAAGSMAAKTAWWSGAGTLLGGLGSAGLNYAIYNKK